MPNQIKNAANIGDVIKHAVLAEIAADWSNATGGARSFVETHAGFCDYDTSLLRTGERWSGERQWALAVVEEAASDGSLSGPYANLVSAWLKRKRYLGSLRVVEELACTSPPLELVGFDIGADQVRSFSARDRPKVIESDGFQGAPQSGTAPRLIFSDPFWSGPDDTGLVTALLASNEQVVVWYLHSSKTGPFRDWLESSEHPFVEASFGSYEIPPWAGQDVRGAGMVLKGVPDHGQLCGIRAIERLVTAFAGRTKRERSLTLRPRYAKTCLTLEEFRRLPFDFVDSGAPWASVRQKQLNTCAGAVIYAALLHRGVVVNESQYAFEERVCYNLGPGDPRSLDGVRQTLAAEGCDATLIAGGTTDEEWLRSHLLAGGAVVGCLPCALQTGDLPAHAVLLGRMIDGTTVGILDPECGRLQAFSLADISRITTRQAYLAIPNATCSSD